MTTSDGEDDGSSSSVFVEDANGETLNNYRQLVEAALVALNCLYANWKPLFEDALDEIDYVVADARRTQKNVNITRTAGSSFSLVASTGLGVGALVSTFAFPPAALPLWVAASVSGVAGGGLSGGSQIYSTISQRKKREQMIQRQRENADRLNQLNTEMSQAAGKLKFTMLEGVHCLGFTFYNGQVPHKGKEMFKIAWEATSTGVAVSYRIAGASARMLGTLSDEAMEVGGALGSTVARTGGRAAGAVIGGFVLAVGAAIDIHSIVDATRSMKNGHKNELVDTLEKMAADMHRFCEKVELLKRQATLIVNGREKETRTAIMDAARDFFACVVCLEASEPPVVQCPECHSILGCRVHLEQWLTVNDGTCPMCRVKWPTIRVLDNQLLSPEFDTFLSILREEDARGDEGDESVLQSVDFPSSSLGSSHLSHSQSVITFVTADVSAM